MNNMLMLLLIAGFLAYGILNSMYESGNLLFALVIIAVFLTPAGAAFVYAMLQRKVVSHG